MHPTLQRIDLYSAYQNRNREMCWLTHLGVGITRNGEVDDRYMSSHVGIFQKLEFRRLEVQSPLCLE